MQKNCKEAVLNKWQSMEAYQPIMPHFNAIPYKAEGSRYGACGIRIDGTPEFIDAVMSHLKELIAGEGDNTRLELARREVGPVEINGQVKRFHNADKQAEVCYIRLHERGGEAQMFNAFVRGIKNKDFSELHGRHNAMMKQAGFNM